MKNINNSFAFTLAEVLITLGIIGIIAALTIPTLIQKTQDQEYIVHIKKDYSVINQAFAQMLANDGVSVLGDTEAFQSLQNNAFNLSSYSPLINASNETFFSILRKYLSFSIVQTSSNYARHLLSGSVIENMPNVYVIQLSDGSFIYGSMLLKNTLYPSSATLDQIRAAGGHMQNSQINNGSFIAIDVNGNNKPNTIGVDIFEFVLSGDGKLYPWLGKDQTLMFPNYTYWRNIAGACGTGPSVDGSGCTADLMENGWVKDY